jgi:putative DNA primase/helicase
VTALKFNTKKYKSTVQKLTRNDEGYSFEVAAWLERSGLTPKELPGVWNAQSASRTIHFYDIDGVRLPAADITRQFSRNGEDPDPKYLHQKGEPPHVYYPPFKGIDWTALARSAEQQKMFAEGCAKAVTATKLGFPTCGIQGCWGWRAAKHGFLRLPEFSNYTWPFGTAGARCYWIPDRERKPKAITSILRSANAFGRVMEPLGAEFYFVWLPLLEGYNKVGLDDFLYYYSNRGTNWDLAKAHFAKLLQTTPRWQDFEITEPGNARRWVSLYGSTFRYAGRSWLAYRNGVWQKDDLAAAEQLRTAEEMFDGMIEDAELAGDNVRRKILGTHVTAQRIENVGRIAKYNPNIIVSPEILDQHPLFVNCLNGTLELPTLQSGAKLIFREARSEDLLTRQTAARWEPNAECPIFLNALKFWTERDEALQRNIRQLVGLSATGVTSAQLFIILFGPTATGKSTFIEIIRETLSSYAVTLSSDTLLVRRNGELEERKVIPLLGARFASASETEQGGVLNENLLKALSGEDTVQGRFLYGEKFSFQPETKIWLRTNNRPEIRGTDGAIWRRVIALPFGAAVAEKNRDPLLRDKLRKERDGIFRWMIEGYLDYAVNGLFKAPVVLDAIEKYRHEQDVFGRFFEEECDFDKRWSIRKDELYFAFTGWFEQDKSKAARAPSAAKFSQELLKREVREGKVTVSRSPQVQERRWIGVTLKVQPHIEYKPEKEK